MSDLDLSSVRGAVWRPGEQGYEEHRQAHQRAVDQRPAAVVVPADVDDVRVVLAAARAAGLTVVVQAVGHGASEDLAGSVLVRMSAFDGVALDEQARRVVVGAGVTAERLAAALAGTGLFAAVGTSPDVSPVPLALGGGHSWISRTVGLTAQTARRVELLRPDGEHGWVDDESDPELMAVLRGAGGLVGIVTAVELELVAAPEAVGGAMTFPREAGARVWQAARDAELSDQANVFASSLRMPDVPFLPEQIRGKSWVGVDALLLDGDASALDPVRAVGTVTDTVAPIGPEGITGITNDPRDPGASMAASALLSGLPDEAIDALLAWHASDAGAAVVALGVRRLGGALDAAALPSVASTRGAAFVLSAIAPVPPGGADAVRGALAQLHEVAAPWTQPGAIPTFLGLDERLDAALTPEDLERVHALRRRLGAEVIRPTRL